MPRSQVAGEPARRSGGLQQRSVPLVGMMLTDLAGAVGRESRRITGRRLEWGSRFEPRIVAPVGAEVRSAAELQASRYRSDCAVVVLLQHAGVPAAHGVGLPIDRTAEAATGSGRILELDHIARKIGRESEERIVEEVRPLPAGDQRLHELVAARSPMLAFAEGQL